MLFQQFLSPVFFVSEACQFFSEYCINYWCYKASDTLVIFILEVYLRQHHTQTANEEQKTETSQKKFALGRPYEPYFIIDIYYI